MVGSPSDTRVIAVRICDPVLFKKVEMADEGLH